MNDMAWQPIAAAVERLRQRVNEVESSAEALLGEDCSFFQSLSLRPPQLGCAELVFLRAIFWLQGLLHECAGSPIRSCLRQTQFSDSEGQGLLYLEELRALRTHAAHNLESTSESDKRTEFTCLQWYRRVCRSTPPMCDDAWNQCTLALVSGADGLLRKIYEFLYRLKAMSENDFLVEEIRRAAVGQITPYAFDSIVASVAADLGRSSMNLEKFRASHQKPWIESLGMLREGYDFQHEARRLVEESFLASPEKSPVSGCEIITQLRVPQGEGVGKLLKIAQQLFESGIRDKAQILERLREHLSSIVSGAP